jgi:FKBP-type peptidyl-prolyl cis-trans isomerase
MKIPVCLRISPFVVLLAAFAACDRPAEPTAAEPGPTAEPKAAELKTAEPAAAPTAAATPAPEQAAASPAVPEVPPDVKAPPANAKKTASGLAYRVLKKGTGTRHPKATDKVTVHYSGWTTDGKMFDSSVTRGQPTSFGLDHVIAGWTEGVQLMVEGEKTRFWIPGKLAYGDHAAGGRPSGMLVFDIELLSIQ